MSGKTRAIKYSAFCASHEDGESRRCETTSVKSNPNETTDAASHVKNWQTQEKCLSSLGDFSKLPTEIRFMIWQLLFDADDNDSDSVPELEDWQSPISIIGANRSFHDEVSYYLQHDLSPYIRITHEIDRKYMVGSLVSMNEQLQIPLKDRAAVQEFLNLFTRCQSKTTELYVEVSIGDGFVFHWSAVDHQWFLVALKGVWYKATDLVEIVKDLQKTYQVDVRVELNPRDRLDKIQSYDAWEWAILPFTDLEVKEFIFPDQFKFPGNASQSTIEDLWAEGARCWSKLSDPDDVSSMHRLIEMEVSRNEIEVDAYLDDPYSDDEYPYPPHSTEFLRSKEYLNALSWRRFQDWFPDKTDLRKECRSRHETRLINNLIGHHRRVLKQDPDLTGARGRHHSLIHWYDRLARRYRPSIGRRSMRQSEIYTTWDSEIWSGDAYEELPLFDTQAFDDCLHENAMSGECPLYQRYRKELFVVNRHADDLQWWGEAAELILDSDSLRHRPLIECPLCLKQGSRCRWCEMYAEHAQKRCTLCRDWR